MREAGKCARGAQVAGIIETAVAGTTAIGSHLVCASAARKPRLFDTHTNRSVGFRRQNWIATVHTPVPQ